MPSESFTYTLMEQEADALQYHCNQEKFETCDVTAYSVDSKKIKKNYGFHCFILGLADKMQYHRKRI